MTSLVHIVAESDLVGREGETGVLDAVLERLEEGGTALLFRGVSWPRLTAGRPTPRAPPLGSAAIWGPKCGAVEAPFEAERRIWDARVQAGSVSA